MKDVKKTPVFMFSNKGFDFDIQCKNLRLAKIEKGTLKVNI